MLVKFNAHPEGKIVRDCVKRAICKSELRSYEEIAKELNDYKKVTGAKLFNEKKNWKKYLEAKGYEKISFSAETGKPRMNGKTFMKQFTKGTYILSMASHLTVCIDGDIYDIWDCTEKCVYTAYRKEEIE